jgi:hypothetical protein
MAVALAALVLAAGGVAFATIPDSGGTIHSCYQKGNGSLRVVESASDCRASETTLSWQQGGSATASSISAAVASSSSPTPGVQPYTDPPANPDISPSLMSTQITTKAAGKLFITTSAGVGLRCTTAPCNVSVGTYVDGQPVPKTAVTLACETQQSCDLSEQGSSFINVALSSSVPAGAHTVSVLSKGLDGRGTLTVDGRIGVLGPVE